MRPRLVIVSGAPGSGKTTLARRLGATLGLPVIGRDDLKEALFDTLGARDRAESRRLGLASYALLYAVAGRLLQAGVGLILESNFNRGRSESELLPLLDGARGVAIHCQGDPAIIARRMLARVEHGERRAGHHDLAALPDVEIARSKGRFEPLALPIPLMLVDTTTARMYEPPFDEIIAHVRGS